MPRCVFQAASGKQLTRTFKPFETLPEAVPESLTLAELNEGKEFYYRLVRYKGKTMYAFEARQLQPKTFEPCNILLQFKGGIEAGWTHQGPDEHKVSWTEVNKWIETTDQMADAEEKKKHKKLKKYFKDAL